MASRWAWKILRPLEQYLERIQEKRPGDWANIAVQMGKPKAALANLERRVQNLEHPPEN